MGRVTVAGGRPAMEVPKLEVPKEPVILASGLAVGSVVKLMENGVAAEYLVVNQGKPSNSSLYDDSCDGTWLLRKDCYESRLWHSSDVNDYQNSTIHSYLNSTFYDLFDAGAKAAIKQVKIPYVNGTGGSAVASGSSGLSAQIFLLSGYEVGWTTSTNSYFPIDGACLSYFSGTSATDSKRIAYLNGSAARWWLRSPFTSGTSRVWLVSTSGSCSSGNASSSLGIRPCVVVPKTAVFDEETLILKGVS